MMRMHMIQQFSEFTIADTCASSRTEESEAKKREIEDLKRDGVTTVRTTNALPLLDFASRECWDGRRQTLAKRGPYPAGTK